MNPLYAVGLFYSIIGLLLVVKGFCNALRDHWRE